MIQNSDPGVKAIQQIKEMWQQSTEYVEHRAQSTQCMSTEHGVYRVCHTAQSIESTQYSHIVYKVHRAHRTDYGIYRNIQYRV